MPLLELILLVVQVGLFCVGCVWMFHLRERLPRLLRELHGRDPKSERWPAMVVLGFSLLWFLWMIGFAFSACVAVFL